MEGGRDRKEFIVRNWCIADSLSENNFLGKQNMSIMQINDIAIVLKEHVAKSKRTELNGTELEINAHHM